MVAATLRAGPTGRSGPIGRAARWVAAGAVLAFWFLVLLAGSMNPGYAPARDYISALASRGAAHAWVGVLALVALPLAHTAVGWLVRRSLPIAGAGLGLAAVAGLVVAADRISCPAGAARCSVAGQARPTDWMDAVHGKAVAVYGVAMVLVLVAVAVGLWRAPGRRGLAVVSAIAAPLSGVLLLGSVGGTHPGLPQRCWLLVNTLWLVAMAVRA